MAIPAIPAHGASWDSWAAGIDDAGRNAARLPDVATAGTPTGDALRAAYVTRMASRVGVLGDSVTYNGGGGGNVPEPRVLARSFMGWANVILGHTFNWTATDGIAGTAITSAGFAARLTAMLAQPIDILVLELGTNDISGGATLAAIQAAYSAAFTQAIAAGKRVVVLTVPPRSGLTGGQQTIWGQVNTWLREQGQAVPGVYVADVAAYLCDPAAICSYVAAYSAGDGIHPNVSGAQQMGRAVAAVLRPMVTNPFLIPAPGSPGNMLNLAATNWTGGASGAPTNWSVGGTTPTSFSQVARADGIPGVWQQVVVATGTGSQLTTGVSGWAAGDIIRIYLEFQTAGAEAIRSTAGQQQFTLALSAYATPSYSVVGATGDVYADGSTECHQPLASGLYLSTPFTVPAGSGELDLSIAMVGGATYSLGRVGVFKVV